ncbi:MAG: aspartyl/glutamyl-tRNA amidotransferase subunit A [Betaproteobacteria bacterium RIFCSPLOWO2_12_FULL_65_14]|nr:MAG: aspartyl/glutamyl-tRNA amidotransferase subunit A [Betaproteobacteria bacterium RIFCSPLOWO2_12_FULL_65_14]
MLNATLTELSAALGAKRVSAVELTRAFLERIGKLNGALNAFITVDEAHSLESARRADERRARGGAGPLTGIPIAHKDIFCTRALRTACGSRMLERYASPYDAHVVEQFERAGAVLLGKCNMDEFAMGSSNETSYFGPVRNPWSKRLVPGGSSGGSAAAVAARMAPAATGTDTGGSIRQPAALTGVSGLKPTYGVVSRYGMVAFASSLDQAGPMAKSAADMALMMNVMAGFDARDSTSLDRPREDYTRELSRDLAGLRMGLPKEYFGEGIESGVLKAVNEAVRWFAAQGAKIVEIELPNAKLGVPVYYVIAPAEASSNLSRFDGVRYGHRAQGYTDLADMYSRTRAEGFGAEVKRRILVGTYVLSHGYYDAYYLQAQKVRRLIARDFAAAFERCDVVLGPTSPTTAFALGAKTDDPVKMYLNDIFTIPAPLAGLPALSVPCGFDEAGLPVGLQLMGNYFSEAALLGVAQRYQQATDWHLRLPTETPL